LQIIEEKGRRRKERKREEYFLIKN